MAFLPTIPTSFTPRTPSAPRQAERFDMSGAFGVFAYLILLIVFVLAIGVFFYNRILTTNRVAQDAALAKSQSAIDPATVEGFVQLRNRLSESNTLLKNHTAFSGFFAALESFLPANVRFNTLEISIDEAGVSKLSGAGVAASFNALAATSAAFASDTRIKDVIFSGITINGKDNTVSFSISATLDPKIVTFSP